MAENENDPMAKAREVQAERRAIEKEMQGREDAYAVQSRREEALRAAALFASNPNWSGTAFGVVNMALTFESYLLTGERATQTGEQA